MASDETTICNLALGKIGSIRIMSLDDATQPARYCKLFYAQGRDEVLRCHDWNFATARATLSQLASAPAFGWAYQYQLPTDCLRVLQLNAYEHRESRPPYVVEQGKLLTDQDAANILYTSRVEDANLFDPLFIKALSIKLASDIVTPLTGSRSQAAELMQEFEGLLKNLASAQDSKEGRPKRKPAWVESDLVNARFVSDIG